MKIFYAMLKTSKSESVCNYSFHYFGAVFLLKEFTWERNNFYTYNFNRKLDCRLTFIFKCH